MPLNLNKEEQRIYEVLKEEPIAIDDLSIKTKWPQSKLAIILLTLEMQGIIVSLPGKVYKIA